MSTINTKYKEWALKSGYPFENEVLFVVNKNFPTSKVLRDVEFIAQNEDGKSTLRSIDFVVSVEKAIQNLPSFEWERHEKEKIEINFVIDCKYTADESYIFIPSTKPLLETNPHWLHLISTLVANQFQKFAPVYRKDTVNLAKINNKIPIASTGRKVKDQTKERDSVSSFLLQVFQGCAHLFKRNAEYLGELPNGRGVRNRNSIIFIPIVVTNAPLLILKNMISISQVNSSSHRPDIFEEVNQLVVEMPNIYDLKEMWSKLSLDRNKSLFDWFNWLKDFNDTGYVLFCTQDGLDSFLTESKVSIDQLEIKASR